MRVLARDLGAAERDDAPTREAAAVAISAADDDRRRAGRRPLDQAGERPEEGFYRRARALGFVTRRR
jgi:hypothetical protein